MVRKRRITRQTKVEYSESKLSYLEQRNDYQPTGKIQTTKLVKPLNNKQREYIDSMKRNVLSIILGPAGTGKDYLAIGYALQLINSENSLINKVYYLRSNVGMSHEVNIGALPGGLVEKTMQLAYPVLDNLIEFMSEGQARYLIESCKVEVLPISMIRGRSFKNSFIILSEAQNCTLHHLKTVITRIGEGSKMVILADQAQIDLKDNSLSGITELVYKIQDLPEVGFVEFTKLDIVRHPIIGHILDRL